MCLDPGSPISRDVLRGALEDGFRDAEAELFRQGLSLFPDPRFDGKCFGPLEKDGIWGSGFGDSSVDQRSQILSSFNILEGRQEDIGFVVTVSLLQKVARVVERLLEAKIPSNLAVVEHVEILIAGTNQIVTLFTLSIASAPFPLSLWPPTVRIRLTETVSINDSIPTVSSNLSSPDIDTDIPLLLRGLVDLAVLPFVSLEGIPIPTGVPGADPTGVPGADEIFLQYIEYLVRVKLTGETLSGQQLFC
jgi:hypothetical protein